MDKVEKVLKKNPNKAFQSKEIAQKTGLSYNSTLRSLNGLSRRDLVEKRLKGHTYLWGIK